MKSRPKESNAEYQLRMDRMALKIDAILDGEEYLDIATVCAGLAAFAIAHVAPSEKQREILLEQLFDFMRRWAHKHAQERPRDN